MFPHDHASTVQPFHSFSAQTQLKATAVTASPSAVGFVPPACHKLIWNVISATLVYTVLETACLLSVQLCCAAKGTCLPETVILVLSYSSLICCTKCTRKTRCCPGHWQRHDVPGSAFRIAREFTAYSYLPRIRDSCLHVSREVHCES
jgi:hypothetical protein